MIKYLLLFSCLTITTASFGQAKMADLSIDILGRPSMGKKLNLYITRKASTIKMVMSKVDSTRFTDLEVKSTLRPLMDSLNSKTRVAEDSARKIIMDKLISTVESHTVYTTDSIIVSKKSYRDYDRLLDSIVTVPVDTLTQTQKNKNRIVLDGIRYRIMVKVKDTVEKDIAVNTPTQQSHRLLRRLISETLAIYRTNRPGSSMSKTYTHGY